MEKYINSSALTVGPERVLVFTLWSSGLESTGHIWPTTCFYIFKWSIKREGRNMGQLRDIRVVVSINKVLVEYSPFIYILFVVAFML